MRVDARVVPERCDGFAVQTVYVLGDEVVDVAGVLEGCEGVMGGIWFGVSDGRIAEVGAEPGGVVSVTVHGLVVRCTYQ